MGARYLGVVEAASSNLVTPTKIAWNFSCYAKISGYFSVCLLCIIHGVKNLPDFRSANGLQIVCKFIFKSCLPNNLKRWKYNAFSAFFKSFGCKVFKVFTLKTLRFKMGVPRVFSKYRRQSMHRPGKSIVFHWKTILLPEITQVFSKNCVISPLFLNNVCSQTTYVRIALIRLTFFCLYNKCRGLALI